MSKWISVNDRLPELEGNYIYYYKDRPYYGCDIGVCWYSKKYGFDFVGVTHWQPLLEPPSKI